MTLEDFSDSHNIVDPSITMNIKYEFLLKSLTRTNTIPIF